MKRILVIGAKGMLGRDLVEVLRASSEDEVIGWDIDEIDIRVEKDTIAKIDHVRPDIVINVAAYTNVDECESQAEKAFAVNAEGMRHVALGAVKCGARVVYTSTDYVFDGQKETPYVEDDPPHPSKPKEDNLVPDFLSCCMRGCEVPCLLPQDPVWGILDRREYHLSPCIESEETGSALQNQDFTGL